MHKTAKAASSEGREVFKYTPQPQQPHDVTYVLTIATSSQPGAGDGVINELVETE